MKKFARLWHAGTVAALALSVTACGGGGGGGAPSPASGSAPPPAATPSPAPAPVPAPAPAPAPFSNLPPASNLAEICTTEADKKSWVRSHLNEHYLWWDEIKDTAPGDYADASRYFDSLLVRTKDENGREKDRFSWSLPTGTANSLYVDGYDIGFGWILTRTSDTRLGVAYVEPQPAGAALKDIAPATKAGLRRGTAIRSINGTPVGNPLTAAQQSALFPNFTGQSLWIEVDDPSSPDGKRRVDMFSSSYPVEPVPMTKLVMDSSGRWRGYILFNTHIEKAEQSLITAIEFLQSEAQRTGVTLHGVVLDLRYNAGGDLNVAASLASMLGGSSLAGQAFERLEHNSKQRTKKDYSINFPAQSFYAKDLNQQKFNLPRLNIRSLDVLTGAQTCSASESIVNGLKPFTSIDIRLIGGTTCGKPYGMYATSNCGYSYLAIAFKGTNRNGDSIPTTGFKPQCTASDRLGDELGSVSESRLSVALGYNSCGTPLATARRGAVALGASEEVLVRPLRGEKIVWH